VLAELFDCEWRLFRYPVFAVRESQPSLALRVKMPTGNLTAPGDAYAPGNVFRWDCVPRWIVWPFGLCGPSDCVALGLCGTGSAGV